MTKKKRSSDKPEQDDNGEFITDVVMGFEFDKEVAKKLRSCDTTMRILADLQEHGVAIVGESFYTTQYGELLRIFEDEYWMKFANKHYVALIVQEIKPVYE